MDTSDVFGVSHLIKIRLPLAMALPALPHRALQVSRGLAAGRPAKITQHKDMNIARKERRRILLMLLSSRNGQPKRMNSQAREITLQDGRYWASRAAQLAAGLGNRHGGIMRIGRALIIPAILALGTASSLFTGSVMPAAAGHQTSGHVHVAAVSARPSTYYRA
jgi:hypothetical protein